MNMETGRGTAQSGSLAEYFSWAADNERLVMAALRQGGLTPVDYDEIMVDAVIKRCVERFGPDLGLQYYQYLIATFLERHKDQFPEFYRAPEDLTE